MKLYSSCSHAAPSRPHPCSLSPKAVLAKENSSAIDYVRDLAFWIKPTELQALYDANPVWASLERQVYGSLIEGPSAKDAAERSD
jgi:hypothetical protein